METVRDAWYCPDTETNMEYFSYYYVLMHIYICSVHVGAVRVLLAAFSFPPCGLGTRLELSWIMHTNFNFTHYLSKGLY